MYNYENLTEESTIMRIDNTYYFYVSHYLQGGGYSFKELKDLFTAAFDGDENESFYLTYLDEVKNSSCSKREFKKNLKKYDFLQQIKLIKEDME